MKKLTLILILIATSVFAQDPKAGVNSVGAWDAPVDNVDLTPITEPLTYEVGMFPEVLPGVVASAIKVVPVDGLKVNFNNLGTLTSGTYHFSVRAVNSFNNKSEWARLKVTYSNKVPLPPKNITITFTIEGE